MSVEALEKVALVNVDLSIWAGYKRTTENELAKIGASLPKDSPLTKGGKKIFPTEFLAEFGSIRKEVSRKLSTIGVAAMGGSARAVPEGAIDDINSYMNDIKVRFNQALVEFDQHYDVRMKNYLDSLSDPNVRGIIDASKLERKDATSKFGMNWQIFKIVPAGNADESSKSLVSGMANTLLQEVADAAKKIFENSFMGKPKVTQKALHQVEALRDKMAGLNFLDPTNIDSIVKSIDETLATLPASGWIDGADLNLLTSVIFKLSNPDLILQHAKLISEGLSTQEAIRKSSSVADVAISSAQTASETPVQPVDANENLFVDQDELVTVESQFTAETPSVDEVMVTVDVTVVEEAQIEETQFDVYETVEAEQVVETKVNPVHETEPEKPKARPSMSKAVAYI